MIVYLLSYRSPFLCNHLPLIAWKSLYVLGQIQLFWGRMILPQEIKEAVSALDHHTRWRIIELIQSNQKLSYTELLQSLSVRKGTLTHHLNKLMESGIIDNYSGEEFSGPYTSYYELSRFGKDFLAALISPFKLRTLFRAVKTKDTSINIDKANKFNNTDFKLIDLQCSISKEYYYQALDSENTVEPIFNQYIWFKNKINTNPLITPKRRYSYAQEPIRKK